MSEHGALVLITGGGTGGHVFPGLAAASALVERGARVLRVHDVAATRQGLAIWSAMHSQDTQTAT